MPNTANPRAEAGLEWCYSAYNHPVTQELYSKVIDWEFAFLIARELTEHGAVKSTRRLASQLEVTQQAVRNKIRKLVALGMLTASGSHYSATDGFTDLLERYLSAVSELGTTLELWRDADGVTVAPSTLQVRDILIATNDFQRSGQTLLTGAGWVIFMELGWASVVGTELDSTRLAAACRLSMNSVSLQLNRLELRGLLVRSKAASDGRKTIWQLSEQGQQQLSSYLHFLVELVQQQLSLTGSPQRRSNH